MADNEPLFSKNLLCNEDKTNLKLILDEIPVGISVVDQNAKWIQVNNYLVEILGYSKEEFLSKKPFDITHQKDIELSSTAFNSLLSGQKNIISFDKRYITKDDKTRWFTITISSIDNNKHFVIVSHDITELKEKEKEIKSTLQLEFVKRDIVNTMVKIFEVHDPYTKGHDENVAKIAKAIAIEMNLSKEDIEWVEISALLHDIGKIAIPSEILSKPRALNYYETELIHQHSVEGYNILKDIEFNWPVADVVLQHHERMDGSGYPNGITGDKILLAAKIIAVADIVDAIGSHRPYRPSLGQETIDIELKMNPDKYDQQVVQTYYKIKDQFSLPQ